MAWAVTLAILLVLVVLVFAPIEFRAGLREDRGMGFSVHWLGIPFRFGGKKKPAAAKPAKAPSKKKKAPGASKLLRMGKAGMAVARAPGVRALLWRTALRSIDALELVKAHLSIVVGVGDPALTGLLHGAFAVARPRFEAGDERVHLELAADFTRARLHVEGEAIVRTRAFPWIVIAVQLLCSDATWRAWRAWKSAMRPKAAATPETRT